MQFVFDVLKLLPFGGGKNCLWVSVNCFGKDVISDGNSSAQDFALAAKSVRTCKLCRVGIRLFAEGKFEMSRIP